MINVAIVGAGASGMMAAIEAARCGAQVTLFEKSDRVGRKILATGNGKCNLSNLSFDLEQYYCKDKLKLHGMFRQFSVKDTIAFFENMGLMIRDKNGYLYPYSEQASSVLDTLRIQMENVGVKIISESEITTVTYNKGEKSFKIKNTAGQSFSFPKLILACGSPASLKKGEGLSGYRLAEQLGHKIQKVVPGLVQLKTEENYMKALAGVRCQAGIKLYINGQEKAQESGEVQFTDYGVSGIPVFQISRIAAYALETGEKVQICVDFFPNYEESVYKEMIEKRFRAKGTKTLEQFLLGTVNKKINMVMIKQAGLKPDVKTSDIDEQKVYNLMQQYKDFCIPISQANTIDKAQICAGGVDFTQVTEKLESKLIDGLFLTGEMLDVDGKCGGYNLQWAWTSGYIAGKNAAGTMQDDLNINDIERGWLKNYAEN